MMKIVLKTILCFALVAANTPCNTLWGLWNPSQPWNGDHMASTANLDTSLGRSSDIVHWYANWGDGSGDMTASWNVPQFITVAQNFVSMGQSQHVPMITWQPWGPKFTVSPAEYPLTNIISGTYDSYISSWASYLKTLGKPFFLRPMHEFDGNWYPWGAVNGNTPAQFKAAWIHIKNIFTNAGATNVLFVWCPTNSNPGGIDQTTYYPGDQYVDWIGIDAYSQNGDSFKTILTQYNPPNLYARLTAMSSKPIMMAEFGVVEGQGVTQAAWIKQALSDIQSSLSQIKGLVYFNQYGYALDTSASDFNTIAPALGGCAPSQAINALLYGIPASTSYTPQPKTTSSTTSTVQNIRTTSPVIVVNPNPTPAHPSWNGPMPSLYYSFNTISSVIQDNSGNGNYGNLIGSGATSAAGIYNGGLALNQANGLSTVQENITPFYGTFSVAIWANIPQAVDVRMKLASSKVNWNDNNGWQIEFYPTQNSISFVGAGGSVAYWGGLPVTYGNWFHVAVVNNGGSVTLYFNGNAQSTIGVSPVTSTTQPLYVGSDGGANAVQGTLDELYIFSAALTAQQVYTVMGDGVYSSTAAAAPTSTYAAPRTTSSTYAAPTTSSTYAAPRTTSSTYAAPRTTSSTYAAPTTSSTYAAPRTTSSTYAAPRVTSAAAPITSSTNAPKTSTFAASSNTCQQGTCGVNLCACGGACYSPGQYCCVNGALTQASQCPSSTPVNTPQANTPAPTQANTPASTSVNAPPAPPTTSASAAVQTCQSMFSSLKCRITSENPADTDANQVAGARGWLCGTYPQYCTQINAGGQWSGCNTVEQMSFAMNAYYTAFGPQQGTQACSFGGLGQVYG